MKTIKILGVEFCLEPIKNKYTVEWIKNSLRCIGTRFNSASKKYYNDEYGYGVDEKYLLKLLEEWTEYLQYYAYHVNGDEEIKLLTKHVTILNQYVGFKKEFEALTKKTLKTFLKTITDFIDLKD